MLSLRPAAISGRTSRPSLFGSSVQQSQSFHQTLGSSGITPTPSDWYERAKEGLAKYDDLVSRTSRIADQAERKKIQDWLGSPIVDGTPANSAQQVLTDIREDVESFIPANVNAYQVRSRTEKIEKLEATNQDLMAMVANASAAHGILPVSQGIIPPPAPDPGPTWLLPVVVVTGALGIAALVTYVYGGKA
jgi:hypothetical protein